MTSPYDPRLLWLSRFVLLAAWAFVAVLVLKVGHVFVKPHPGAELVCDPKLGELEQAPHPYLDALVGVKLAEPFGAIRWGQSGGRAYGVLARLRAGGGGEKPQPLPDRVPLLSWPRPDGPAARSTASAVRMIPSTAEALLADRGVLVVHPANGENVRLVEHLDAKLEPVRTALVPVRSAKSRLTVSVSPRVEDPAHVVVREWADHEGRVQGGTIGATDLHTFVPWGPHPHPPDVAMANGGRLFVATFHSSGDASAPNHLVLRRYDPPYGASTAELEAKVEGEPSGRLHTSMAFSPVGLCVRVGSEVALFSPALERWPGGLVERARVAEPAWVLIAYACLFTLSFLLLLFSIHGSPYLTYERVQGRRIRLINAAWLVLVLALGIPLVRTLVQGVP